MKKIFSYTVIGILALFLFVLANLSVSWLCAQNVIDATSAKQYTLSPQSVQTAKNLSEELTFRFYASANLGNYDWNMGEYAAKIVGLLNQYQLVAPDKIKLEVYRLKDDSDAGKQQAVQNGIIALSTEEQDYFFGLNVQNSHKSLTIPAFNPARGNLIEADLLHLISQMEENNPVVVGIVSPKLPLWEKSDDNPSSALMAALKEYYTVVPVLANTDLISQKTDVLLVVYPVEFSTVFGYALDQYVMRGGKVIFIVDPYSEEQHKIQGYPPRPDKEMSEYLQKWGVRYHSDTIVGNMSTAEKIKDNDGSRYLYPLWFFTSGKNGEKLHFRTAGEISLTDTDRFDYTVLATTGKQGGEIKTEAIRYAPKSAAANSYRQDNQEKIVALSVKGKFYSHYYGNIAAGTDSEKNVQPYLPFSDDGSITVIADSDFLTDSAWVASYNKDNPVYGTVAYADNLSFLVSQINYLAGREILNIPNTTPMQSNIAEVLYQRSLTHFLTEREEAETAAVKSSSYFKKLQSRNKNSEDVAFRKLLSEAERQYTEDLKHLKTINHKITATADKSLASLLLVNLLILPLSLLLVIYCTVKYGRWRFKKQLESKEGKK